MKVDKYLARCGFASRRKALILIEEKRVKVNDKTATYKTEVGENDVVTVDGVAVKAKPFVPTCIAYHKPKGIECTTEKIPNNIIDAINHPQTIYPVGRLDKDSEGLILLTNHAGLINAIAHADAGHEKEYIVTLNLPVRKAFLDAISQGIEILGQKTRPCRVSLEPGTKRVFRIVLTQGMNRQIRRMCNAFNYQVIKLQRVRIMHVTLGKLTTGEWRDLTNEEMALLPGYESPENNQLPV